MRWRFLASSLATVIAVTFANLAPAQAAALATQAEWTQAVHRRIANRLSFPREARHLSGAVAVSLKITVLRDGTVDNITVAKSSGDNAVDNATIAMVQRAGPLPAFSTDMQEGKTSLVVPVRFQQEEDDAPAPAPRRYVDPATRFGVTVAAPFTVGAAGESGRYDALIEISNPGGLPPMAPGARFLCRAGFNAAPAGAANTAAPKGVQAFDALVAAATRQQRKLRGTIEELDVFDQPGRRGIDYLVAPGAGPGHEDARQYIADWTVPQGRIRLACATTRDAMPEALATFRAIRDAVAVDRR
ncbi:energy transducer TonB [Achromobacter sp. UMC71]|uniref:energy transducer TonB n=1 Tax=Achromobacter sp. UMC71 TaxID=1862320 RepID=UPI0015FF718E|nr:energy transducer TonB [Achromobacter sp. UMC71]MBB1626486.1 hypothetical protein [Achromobacter sp. UMC71]